MDTKHIRASLFIALFVDVILGLFLFTYPFGQWGMVYGVLSQVGMGITLLFALAVVLLLAAFSSPAGEWESPLFRYMNKLWGNVWSGRYRYDCNVTTLSCISVCRAIRLTVVTICAWLVFVGFAGGVVYFTILILYDPNSLFAMGGTEQSAHSIFAMLPALYLWTIMSLVFVMLSYQKLTKGEVEDFPEPVVTALLVAIGVANLFVYPMRLFGFSVTMLFLVKWIFVGAVIIAVVGGLIWIVFRLLPSWWTAFEKTAPGVVVWEFRRGLKDYICPYIIKVHKPKHEHEE